MVERRPATAKGKKILQQMCDVMRLKHCSFRTEQTYCDWVERFILFHVPHAAVGRG
jgi:Phage integrase, N-terminal SAM-like domain